jgi:hypothetical protein
MINDIEVSPNNKARCKICGRKINEGTPRGVEYTSYGFHPTTIFYCHKHIILKIKDDIEEFERKIKQLKEMEEKFEIKMKECYKALTLEELE